VQTGGLFKLFVGITFFVFAVILEGKYIVVLVLNELRRAP
jgi:hypothetical protein